MKKTILYTVTTLTILGLFLFIGSCKKDNDKNEPESEFWTQTMTDSTCWAILSYRIISNNCKKGNLCMALLPNDTKPFEDGEFICWGDFFYEINGQITLTGHRPIDSLMLLNEKERPIICTEPIIGKGYYHNDTMYLSNSHCGPLKLIRDKKFRPVKR